MFAAAVRVLARAATIQLEEAASAHPRPPPSLLKGKQRAAATPIRDLRHDRAVPETDLGVVSSGSTGRQQTDHSQSDASRISREPAGKGLQDQFATITSELVDEPVNKPADLAGPSRPRRDTVRNAATAPTGIESSKPSVLTDDTLSKPPAASNTGSTTNSTTTSPVPTVKPSKPIAPQQPLSKIEAKTFTPPSRHTKEEPRPALTSAPDSRVERTQEDVIPAMSEAPEALVEEQEESQVMLRASKVPSSRIGRLFHYGSLAASMGWGAASEGLRRSAGGTPSGGSVFMSDANIRRLVSTLGRMRGAALKLGQFMSIQDNNMLPPEIEKVLQQVQAHANYMPDWQMEKVMSTEFGADWQKMFSSFDRVPIASASIGQVHKATMAETGLPVAVKIQFPGIASSINSDLSNLSILLRSSALLPKGLYLQNTIAVMKRELEDECDYIREAESGRRFSELLKDYDYFKVPHVVDQASSSKVLTVEWMEGKPLSRIKGLSQEARDKIGENALRLCLLELFKFRFMQTDPNWANFLYDTKAHKLGLIDFGASREYTKEFMDGWYRLLTSALKGDREAMKTESENLGYLTGEENEMMIKAHLDSMALVASPFHHSGPYAFAQQTITSSVRSLIPIMLAHRLTPPPQETYSLNRKLSGAFLMCAKLESRVDCAKLWEEVVGDYKQGPE